LIGRDNLAMQKIIRQLQNEVSSLQAALDAARKENTMAAGLSDTPAGGVSNDGFGYSTLVGERHAIHR
jgi:uncharacterized protein YlxW (UPF0749 family)